MTRLGTPLRDAICRHCGELIRNVGGLNGLWFHGHRREVCNPPEFLNSWPRWKPGLHTAAPSHVRSGS